MSQGHDPLDIRSQEQARKDADDKARLAAENEAKDFRRLMGVNWGRRIVWRQLEQAGVFRSTFNTVAMQMAFDEGKRNAGLRTLGMIHQNCPELYPVMVKENATHGKQPAPDRAQQ